MKGLIQRNERVNEADHGGMFGGGGGHLSQRAGNGGEPLR